VQDLVRNLKALPGGDIGIHGRIQLAQSLLEADSSTNCSRWSAGLWISRPPAVRERRRHRSARVAQRSTDNEWQRVARLPHYLS